MGTGWGVHALIASAFSGRNVTVIGIDVHRVSVFVIRIALVIRVALADARVGRRG